MTEFTLLLLLLLLRLFFNLLKMPALGKEETRGLVGPSVDRAAEAGVGTLAVLPWASRSIFLAPGKGTLSYTRAKGKTLEPASFACCSAPHPYSWPSALLSPG